MARGKEFWEQMAALEAEGLIEVRDEGMGNYFLKIIPAKPMPKMAILPEVARARLQMEWRREVPIQTIPCRCEDFEEWVILKLAELTAEISKK